MKASLYNQENQIIAIKCELILPHATPFTFWLFNGDTIILNPYPSQGRTVPLCYPMHACLLDIKFKKKTYSLKYIYNKNYFL